MLRFLKKKPLWVHSSKHGSYFLKILYNQINYVLYNSEYTVLTKLAEDLAQLKYFSF